MMDFGDTFNAELIVREDRYMFLPTVTGPYSVGSSVFTILNDNRKEICGPFAGKENRRVTARIFYPVDSKDTNGLDKAILLSRNGCRIHCLL